VTTTANEIASELAVLGTHLAARRGAILEAWRAAVLRDDALISVRVLTRAEINDHIPELLADFERDLGGEVAAPPSSPGGGAAGAAPLEGESGALDAAAHGLRRWQQGYELLEVAVELGRLNEAMCIELERYAAAHPALLPGVMAEARRRWARACTVAIGESTTQYHRLQQLEAAGHIEELEAALDDLLELERLRAELWQQAAHDLRGNVAVVANATAGLAVDTLQADTRERFLRLLQRNVRALNHLLNDVTTLARLQAGEEQREVAPFDAAVLLRELCQGLQGLAEERCLTLSVDGPPSLAVDGDAVKTRRIAQNLILNALTYTRRGGVELSWGDAPGGDAQRWILAVRDTGPGLHARASAPLAGALEQATAQADPASGDDTGGVPPQGGLPKSRKEHGGGEGLGLSIVKRLCDLMDASVEVESTGGVGTTFRILLPKSYPA
jgi:signal transduction histidine kinase